MKVTALQPFAHGAYRAAMGDEVDMPDAIAGELEKHGFVTSDEKAAPKPKNKIAPKRENKAVGAAKQAAKADE